MGRQPRFTKTAKPKRFFKFCKRCDKKFHPVTRDGRLCPSCVAKSRKQNSGKGNHSRQYQHRLERMKEALKNA